MNRLLLTLTATVGALSLFAQNPTPAPTTVQPVPAPALPAPTQPPPIPETAPATEAPAKPKKKAAPSTLPFRGKVEAVDAKAMTVTLAGKEKQRVLTVTSKTRFEKDGKPATFGDVKAGEDVRGSYAKTKEGENLVRLIIGAPASAGDKKPAGEAKHKKPAKKEAPPTAEAPAEQK